MVRRQWRRGFTVARLCGIVRLQVDVLRQTLRHLVVRIAYRTADVGQIVVRVGLHMVVVLLVGVRAKRCSNRFLCPLLPAAITWILGSTNGVADVVPATS